MPCRFTTRALKGGVLAHEQLLLTQGVPLGVQRAICCYPDMPRLAGAAADHARHLLVLSYPRLTWWTQIGLTLGNWLLWMMRREFHIFLHPPQQILATSERHGLKRIADQQGMLLT